MASTKQLRVNYARPVVGTLTIRVSSRARKAELQEIVYKLLTAVGDLFSIVLP
jgi:hypothetical protein